MKSQLAAVTRFSPILAALRSLPTVTALVAVIYLTATNSSPSQTADIGIYSYFRLIFFAAATASACYLLIALFKARLQRWNNFFLYGLLTNLALVELVFRLFPSLVPLNVMPLLPSAAREYVAASRSIPTAASYRGDGMLYSHAPHSTVVAARPWIKLDADGYRNVVTPSSTDVVILGDSVMFAAEARQDLAELFGRQGLSAYNLAMGGYSPFHYRDAYRKYVVERRLPHRVILIGLVPTNDIQESLKYILIRNQGGDFRDFLGNPGGAEAIGAAWLERQPFWTVALMIRLPSLIKDKLSTVRSALAGSFLGSDLELSLPYARLPVPASIFDYPAIALQPAAWGAFTAAMDELIGDSVAQGATPVVLLLPSPGLLLSRYIRNGDDYKSALEKNAAALKEALIRRYQPRGAQVLDLAPPMADALALRSLLAAPLDYHYNTDGMKVLADVLSPALR